MSLYYQDEHVTLYHGDCLTDHREWLDADVLVTDPPYGIGWKRPKIKSAFGGAANEGIANDSTTQARDRAVEAWGSGPALVFGSLQAAFPSGWKRMLVFEKPLHSGLIGSRAPWFRNWEPIFVVGDWPNQTPTRGAVIKTGWKSASGYSGYTTKAGHSHAKPNDVMEELIVACPPGVVADPFAGSGSTLVAARNLGRKAIGVELEEKYCEIIAKRLDQQVIDFEALM